MKKVGFGYVLLTFLVAYSFGKFIGGKKKTNRNRKQSQL